MCKVTCALFAFALSVAISNAEGIPSITLNNGVSMPVIAAGTWQYSPSEAKASVKAAIAAGFKHIDAAFDYNNQEAVGAGIKETGVNRSDIFVTSKVPGCGLQGISRTHCGQDSLAVIQKNLDQLGTTYLDLVLIHFPPVGGCGPLNCPIIRKQWAAFESAYAQKKVRSIGVSNFCVSCFECLFGGNYSITPAVNQVQYHVGEGVDPGGLFSYCKKHGIVTEAYSPLGDNKTEILSGKLTTSIAKAQNKTAAQVALRWIWQNGVALTTKSSSFEHLKEDLDIFDWSLTEEEMSKLNAATQPAGKPSFMCDK